MGCSVCFLDWPISPIAWSRLRRGRVDDVGERGEPDAVHVHRPRATVVLGRHQPEHLLLGGLEEGVEEVEDLAAVHAPEATAAVQEFLRGTPPGGGGGGGGRRG